MKYTVFVILSLSRSLPGCNSPTYVERKDFGGSFAQRQAACLKRFFARLAEWLVCCARVCVCACVPACARVCLITFVRIFFGCCLSCVYTCVPVQLSWGAWPRSSPLGCGYETGQKSVHTQLCAGCTVAPERVEMGGRPDPRLEWESRRLSTLGR